MESWKASQTARYQREMLQDIQVFANGKEEKERFSQCGSKKMNSLNKSKMIRYI